MSVPSEPFWMVYGEDQNAPRVCHRDFYKARKEAERLASTTPGVRFFVMASVGVAQKIEVNFREINPEEIPF